MRPKRLMLLADMSIEVSYLTSCSGGPLPRASGGLLLAAALLAGSIVFPQAFGQQPPSIAGKTLRSIDAVFRLSKAEARKAYPVELDAVVTYSDMEWGLLFVQTGGVGVYIDVHGKHLQLAAGTRVTVHAVTGEGDLGPVLVDPDVRVAGRTVLPVPERRTLAELDAAAADSKW